MAFPDYVTSAINAEETWPELRTKILSTYLWYLDIEKTPLILYNQDCSLSFPIANKTHIALLPGSMSSIPSSFMKLSSVFNMIWAL